MDPTKDLAKTRKLMASVMEALERIIDDFKQRRQQALPTDTSVRGRS